MNRLRSVQLYLTSVVKCLYQFCNSCRLIKFVLLDKTRKINNDVYNLLKIVL